MHPYTGFEPAVGEIRALRTFRVGPEGVLYPLFVDVPWSDGINSAACRAARAQGGDSGQRGHDVPWADCTCGFYAFATASGAAEYPHAKHVLATVACWGRVVAGTRGVRAQHARIEAIWMSSRVPPDLVALVIARYPSVAHYDDQRQMLADHPPTQLDCYQTPTPQDTTLGRASVGFVVLTAFVLGMLPAQWILHNDDVRFLWLAGLVVFGGGALGLRLTRGDFQAKRVILFCVAMTLWLLAPFGGTVGVLMLHLPIVQITILGIRHRAQQNAAAGRFPAQIGVPAD